jgi:hypothetical protein
LPVFPIRNSDLIEVENELGETAMHEFSQTLNRLVRKTARNFEARRFLRSTFDLEQPVQMTPDERIDPTTGYWQVVTVQKRGCPTSGVA